MFIRRQLSMIERMAATFGPAWALPTWIQFLLPTAIVFHHRIFGRSQEFELAVRQPLKHRLGVA